MAERRMNLALILIGALLAFSGNVDGARILGIFPHTGRSHQMVFEPYLQKLAERGHEVTVVSFFPRKIHIENYTDVSLEGLAPLGVEVLDMSLFEHGSLMKKLGLREVEKFFSQVMEFGFLAKSALEVCSKIVDFPPLEKTLKKQYDLVIVENFNSDCVFGLLHVHEVKSPVIGLLSSSFLPWSSERVGLFENPAYVPVVSSSFTASMNYMERLQNTFLSVFYKLWYRYMIQVKEQALIEMRYGKVPDLQELGSKFSMMLVNTFHSLNGVRPLLPGIVEVGGMHLNPKSEILPQYIQKFLNESEHGVVLVSFGSLLKTSTLPKYREELIIKALSKLKQRVIWKFETSDEEGSQINNILRVKWLPQYQLLKHNKVMAFVAHGGLLGMTEAISAGKPMLVIPFFGDQPFNGKQATEAGLATVLEYDDMNEKTLYEALQKVLGAEMRVKARQASKIWLDRPALPMDTAVYWTERVIRWGANAPLHSVARDLNIFQIALLDVLAACILVVLAIVFVVKSILSVIKGLFTSRKVKVH